MKNKTFLLILSLTVMFVGLSAQSVLRHDQPSSYSPNAETMILLEITEEVENVSEANLFYRESGDFSYINLQMLRSEDDPNSFFTNIPPMPDNKKGIEYYFEVVLKSGSVIVEPAGNPATINPYRLFLELPSVSPSKGFVLLSPSEPSIVPEDELVIAVSMFAIENDIAPGTIKIKFDGKDRSKRAVISSNMVVLNLGKPRPGRHSFTIEAKHKNNGKTLYRSWNVTVNPEKKFELPMDIKGRLSVSTKLKSKSSDNESREDDDKYANYNLNLNGKKKWFSFNTNLMITSRESSKRQSRNRYSVTLKVPHFDFVIGDHAPRYDSFTMQGKNIRGYHPKLHFKNFSIAVSFGQSQRALDGKISSTTNQAERYGTFQRNSLGLRMEIGSLKTMNNSFLWGISVAKSKDKLSSLDEKYFLHMERTEVDDSVSIDTVHVITPKDNFVVGTDLTLNLYKKRLIWGAEFAVSMYNKDIINGVATEQELKDMGVSQENIDNLPDLEAFEDLFVINKNVEPFLPGKANMASKFFLNLNVYHNYLTFSYSEIGASFNSLSSSTGQKDARIINITDYLHLWQNKVLLSFGHTHSTDNLSNHRNYDYKSDSYFFNANLRFPNMPTFSVGYSSNNNFDEGDSVKHKDTQNNRFNTSIGYEVKQIAFAPTKFSVTYSTSTNVDDYEKNWDNSSNTIGFTAYSRYKDLPMSSIIRYTTTAADNKNKTADYNSDYNSLFFKVNYNLLGNKIRPYVSYQMVSNTGDNAAGDIDKSINTFATGASFSVLKNTDLSTVIMVKGYADGEDSENDYSLFDWGMKASYKF